MEKKYIYIGMFVSVLVIIFLSNIFNLFQTPLITPEEFLSEMPYLEFSLFGNTVILIQPSSTFFVYLLGVIMILIGIYFVLKKEIHAFNYYFGVGMILWGISALVAGSSYQAFGYELKCRNQDYCLFTSNFELVYLLITAYSINFLVVATGHITLDYKPRQWLVRFAIVDSLLYFLYLLIGSIIPIQFLISYEGFILFIGLNFILMFILNIHRYLKNKEAINHDFIIIWLGFLFVNVAYFAYLFSGIADDLYTNSNIWFNANDVLHILLMLWSILIFLLLRNKLISFRT